MCTNVPVLIGRRSRTIRNVSMAGKGSKGKEMLTLIRVRKPMGSVIADSSTSVKGPAEMRQNVISFMIKSKGMAINGRDQAK